MWSSDPEKKPLEVNLKHPLPEKLRVYIFNATHPPGGRTLGEHKIQVILPGQLRGHRANFDHSGGRIVLLAGFEPELRVFVLWDAGLYTDIAYSRNVQVRAEKVYAAFAGEVILQDRQLWDSKAETIVLSPEYKLCQALKLREQVTCDRLATS